MGNEKSKLINAHFDTASKSGMLHLSGMKLKALPSKINEYQNVLRIIDASKNQITVFPQAFCCLVNLKQLRLDDNLLSSLPEEIGNLKKLEIISMNRNQISTLPSSFFDLPNLKEVYFESNLLDHFPIGTFQLKNLTVLDLAMNKIPLIPDGVNQLQATELNLKGNVITYISANIAKCPKLKILMLDDNQLELRNIPAQLLADSKVTKLSVNNNNFPVNALSNIEGYDKYMQRYTDVMKKMF